MLTEASPIAVGCEVQFADRAPLGLRETTMNRIRTGHTELKGRSEEHTSELQSRQYLVCRLLFDISSRAGGTELKSPTLLSSRDPEPQREDLWLFIGEFQRTPFRKPGCRRSCFPKLALAMRCNQL